MFVLKHTNQNVYFPKKSTILDFVIFYNHLHQDLIFGQFAPRTCPPWGTPHDHPYHHLPLCFLYPTSPRMRLFLPKSWPFLHDFSFLAPTSILALFGPFWPTLARWPNSGGPWSGHQWCFPTYIHHAPCKKPRPAQGDDMRSFWDNPVMGSCWENVQIWSLWPQI